MHMTTKRPPITTLPSKNAEKIIINQTKDVEYYDDDYNYDYEEEENSGMTVETTVTPIDLEEEKKMGTPSITRVLGRYMSVDNDRLMQIDQMSKIVLEKGHKQKKATKLIKKRMQANTSNMSSGHHRQPSSSVEGIETPAADAVAAKTMNLYSGEDVLTTKELIDDMERIMKNGNDIREHAAEAAVAKHKSKRPIKGRGACFTGADSYFHYNDAETMRQVISYKIDLNLRFKTHSVNGLILWTGRHSALEEDDYLSLGIENGYEQINCKFLYDANFLRISINSYLHLRYNLGSGEVNIQYNSTRVSDGLWHRIRAFR